MPVKVAYTRAGIERRVADSLGFAAIYALGVTEGPDVGRLKIGVAPSDKILGDVVASAQHFSSWQVGLMLVLWTTAKPLALQIKQRAELRLAREGLGLRGTWYAIEPGELSDRLLAAAREAGAEVFDESGRRARIDAALQRAMDRAVRG